MITRNPVRLSSRRILKGNKAYSFTIIEYKIKTNLVPF